MKTQIEEALDEIQSLGNQLIGKIDAFKSITSTNTGVFVNDKWYAIKTPISGIDVRCAIPMDWRFYLMVDVTNGHNDPTPKEYVDSSIIPSGTKIWMVPPAHT